MKFKGTPHLVQSVTRPSPSLEPSRFKSSVLLLPPAGRTPVRRLEFFGGS
jgi:hypothetical protein